MLGGGSTLGVGVTMFLRDQFSGPAARVRTSAQQTTEQLRRMQEDQLRQQRNMYAGLAVAGGLAIRRMGQVVKSAAQFGFEMEFVKQISKSTVAEQAKLSDQAMDLGQSTIFFAKDVAEGMRFMAMAGMKYEDITGNVAAAVNLAAAANLSIAGRGGAADILTNIMIAFKKEASESGYVADILAEAATSANTNVFELGEALKYSASTARTLNIVLEESTAILMTLADAGMQGSMAGVAFENSMRYLAQAIGNFASGTQKKALEALGLSADDFQDASGNLNSMVQNITVLKNAMVGMGTVERYNISKVLFGVRGARAGLLLIANYERFINHLNIFQGAQGRATEISMGMMDTLEGSIRRLKAVWTHLGIFFTEGLVPVLRPVLRLLEGFIKGLQWLFKIPILGNFMSSALAGFLVIKTVAFGLKAIKAGIALITLQNTALMTRYAAATVTGYRAMTTSAMQYSVAARAAAAASIGGMATRGVVGVNVAGGLYRTVGGRTGRAGAAISAGAAARYAARYGARKVAGQTVGRAALGLAGGRALLPILGRIAGVLGGPLGIALAFVIPGAIGLLVGALRKNREATQNHAETIRKNKDLMMGGRVGAIEFLEFNKNRLMAAKDILNLNVLGSQDITPPGFQAMVQKTLGAGGMREEQNAYMQTQPIINIYLDGEEITGRTLEKVMEVSRRSYHNAGMQ